MVIAWRIWRPGWWVLSKALIFTAPIWCAYLIFSYDGGEFLQVGADPWVKPNFELSETSCTSWDQVRYDTCEG